MQTTSTVDCISDVLSLNSDLLDHSVENNDYKRDFGDLLISKGDPYNGKYVYVSKRGTRCFITYDRVGKSGTEVSFRCTKCRNCKDCLHAELVEEISFIDEKLDFYGFRGKVNTLLKSYLGNK